MKIIQRPYLKFLIVFIFLTTSTFHVSSAQISGFRLKTADSLFQATRYTQSLEHYEEILKQRQYTPAMLLKMAYIHEGLNQIGPAMYYLNLYHIATNDKVVLEKMDELATKYNLMGYETTDTDRFLSFYLDHHLYVSIILAALTILLLSVMYYSRIKQNSRPVLSGLTVFFLLLALGVHQFYGTNITRGIISDTSTYLMDGPSPAASVVQVVGDGHRVEVVGKKDVWMKIKWRDEAVYVRENSLRPLKL